MIRWHALLISIISTATGLMLVMPLGKGPVVGMVLLILGNTLFLMATSE